MDTVTISMAEMASSSFDTPLKIFSKTNDESFSKKIQPTEKPVAPYKWLLTKYAKPGDLILDTHVGSASSLIACYDLGFSAVGFEIDEEYYRISKERLENHMKQLRFNDMWEAGRATTLTGQSFIRTNGLTRSTRKRSCLRKQVDGGTHCRFERRK